MQRLIFLYILLNSCFVQAQEIDSLENYRLSRMITLTEAVVRNDLDVLNFIDRIRKDTTFYKAFSNLRVLGYTSLNDIRMLDKKGRTVASLQNKIKQHVSNGCRTMETENEKVTGDFYSRSGDYNYYTAELYASLFFTKGKVCGETNIVSGVKRDVSSKKGIEKHKEQLKMLYFDPGKKVPGIPLMGNRTEIFSPDMAANYDFHVDLVDFEGQLCYQFSVQSKDPKKRKVVINHMTTWFNSRSFEIVGRNYRLSYNTGVYDFDVYMEVVMTRFRDLLVPKVLRYNGTWDVAFRKREKGIFTATLFDFKEAL